ncbi:ATP-binding cassette domain-containing protein [Streptomyces sp. C10-9-1]|uniref:ATP-binding cassette domain-containing protein n=1 Tax=Streptomyces sp. C10-9-1 TaxID=1859285 RepID=UPI003D750352
MTAAMEALGVRVRYGPLEALHGVGLTVPSGAVTVLLGRNGSGRTTLLRVLAGTVRPTEGTVLLWGRDVTALAAHRRARAGVLLVPEAPAVHAGLTVRDNLELVRPGADQGPALQAYPALKRLLDRRAATLSGGERRMLAVGRALLSPAGVLLLDEPVVGMAPGAAASTYRLLSERAATGTAVVLAEQQLPGALARETGPAVVVAVLRRGAVVFRGEAAEVG